MSMSTQRRLTPKTTKRQNSARSYIRIARAACLHRTLDYTRQHNIPTPAPPPPPTTNTEHRHQQAQQIIPRRYDLYLNLINGKIQELIRRQGSQLSSQARSTPARVGPQAPRSSNSRPLLTYKMQIYRSSPREVSTEKFIFSRLNLKTSNPA